MVLCGCNCATGKERNGWRNAMSKSSNTKLLLALVALIAIVAGVKLWESRKGERNFKAELVNIDSAKVSTILIYPKAKKGEEVKLTKEGNEWKVKMSDTKSL